MSAARTAPRTRPTTVGWIAIIIFVFLAGLGTIAALAAVAVFNSVNSNLAPPSKLTTYVLPEETIVYDRTGKIELARFGDAKRELVTVRRDPQGPARCDDRGRGQDLLGQRRVRPRRHRLGGDRLVAWRQPWRLDDHPAARAQHAARAGPRPGPAPDGRAQAQGDHRVDPDHPGVPGRRGQAAGHHRLPEPELLRQPELRREGRGPVLLRHRPQGHHPGTGRDHRRAAQVPLELRPRPQRGGELPDGGRRGHQVPEPAKLDRPQGRGGRRATQPDPRAARPGPDPDVGEPVHVAGFQGRGGRGRQAGQPGDAALDRTALRVGRP